MVELPSLHVLEGNLGAKEAPGLELIRATRSDAFHRAEGRQVDPLIALAIFGVVIILDEADTLLRDGLDDDAQPATVAAVSSVVLGKLPHELLAGLLGAG